MFEIVYLFQIFSNFFGRNVVEFSLTCDVIMMNSFEIGKKVV